MLLLNCHLPAGALHAGLLHVTAVQAGNCLERFSDIENLTAPPLQPLSTALQDTTNSNSSKVVSEAVCLATPPDNPTETENGGQVVRQLQGQSSNGRGSISSVAGNRSAGVRAAALQSEAEDLAALEAHVCERTVMFNMYTAEVLQASADIRRQRRRAMVRAIRASRQTARAILAAPQVALASCLASLDGAVGTADEQ